MHPCYKKKYFARARWPRTWVDKSLRLLRMEWETHYRHAGEHGADNSAPGSSRGEGAAALAAGTVQGSAVSTYIPTRTSASSMLTPNVLMRQVRAARNMLASITGADELEDKDALEEYLEAPIRMKKTDPLKFWNNALVNGTANAALARMALDVLSIPGTCSKSYFFGGIHMYYSSAFSSYIYGCQACLLTWQVDSISTAPLTVRSDRASEHCARVLGSLPRAGA